MAAAVTEALLKRALCRTGARRDRANENRSRGYDGLCCARRYTAACAAVALFASCSFIDVREGALAVRTATEAQVTQCELVGKTTSSVVDHIGFINRDPAKVDADMATLARNSAVSLGGDTIVPGERPRRGERVFSVYRCVK
jgi:hypothetical protein